MNSTATDIETDIEQPEHAEAPTGADIDIDGEQQAQKLAEDDPSLDLPATPGRRIKPAALVIVGTVGALCIAGLVVARSYLPATTPIAEEPKRPTLARAPALPGFIAAAPATPMPMPVAVDPPRPPPSFAAAAPLTMPVAPASIDPALARRLAERARLDEQARTAGIFVETSASPGRSGPGATGGSRTESEGPDLAVITASLQAAGLQAGAAAAAGANAGAAAGAFDPNLQDHKTSFLNAPRKASDYLASTLQRPISRYELKATSIIPVTLITGINSDLPGPVSALVRERVYDTVTGEHLLIPQGARLFGNYDSKVAFGQERVLLCWDRVLFPNGSSINLECMPATDLRGQAGLTDEVDHHYDRLAVAVGLSTILAVGTQVVAGNPTGYQQTIGQTAASNAAGMINSAGQAIVSKEINIQPTVTVRPGFAANLFVTKDIVLEPYAD